MRVAKIPAEIVEAKVLESEYVVKRPWLAAKCDD